MTISNPQSAGPAIIPWVVWTAIAVVLIVALWPLAPHIIAHAQRVGFHPHAPDLARLAATAPQIKIHVAAAVTAFIVGVIILMQPKGPGLHKALGWTWVIAMAVTAVSSFFITGVNGNSLSALHLISGWTVVALPMGLFAIRNKRVLIHRRIMMALFIGGLVVAGALNFLPGRLMYALFFG